MVMTQKQNLANKRRSQKRRSQKRSNKKRARTNRSMRQINGGGGQWSLLGPKLTDEKIADFSETTYHSNLRELLVLHVAARYDSKETEAIRNFIFNPTNTSIVLTPFIDKINVFLQKHKNERKMYYTNLIHLESEGKLNPEDDIPEDDMEKSTLHNKKFQNLVDYANNSEIDIDLFYSIVEQIIAYVLSDNFDLADHSDSSKYNLEYNSEILNNEELKESIAVYIGVETYFDIFNKPMRLNIVRYSGILPESEFLASHVTKIMEKYEEYKQSKGGSKGKMSRRKSRTRKS